MNTTTRRLACVFALTSTLWVHPLRALETEWAPASAADPRDVVVIRMYDGAAKPASEVAAVYGFDGGRESDGNWFCAVDGKDLQQTVAGSVHCASVVYLLPGKHVLSWRYRSFTHEENYRDIRQTILHGDMEVTVEAGRAYDFIAASLVSKTPKFIARPAGTVLHFTDINPSFPNALIPD